MLILAHNQSEFKWEFNIGAGTTREIYCGPNTINYGYHSLFYFLKNRIEHFLMQSSFFKNNNNDFGTKATNLQAIDRLQKFINYIYAPDPNNELPGAKQIADYTIKMLPCFEILQHAIDNENSNVCQILIAEIKEVAEYILK